MKSIYKKKILFIILAFCLAGPQLWATDYYVKADGSDTNDGKTLETALKTMKKAVALAADNDVIYISGEAAPETAVNITNRVLTFVGINNAVLKPSGTVRIFAPTNSKVSFENLELTGGEFTSDGALVKGTTSIMEFVNCYIHDNKAAKGVISSVSGDNYMRHCLIKSNTSTGHTSGLIVSGTGSASTFGKTFQTVFIEGCSFVDNSGKDGTAIYLTSEADNTIFTAINTTIARNTAIAICAGILVYNEKAGCEYNFINTTFSENKGENGSNGALNFWGDPGKGQTFQSKIRIHNSILYGNSKEDKAPISGFRIRIPTTGTGSLEIKNSIVYIIQDTENQTGHVSYDILGAATIENSSVGVNAVDPGLATYDEYNHVYPMLFPNIDGDASLLAAYGYHTDQLKQYRSFAGDICCIGATEWYLDDPIVPTTTITAAEMAGYYTGSLKNLNTLTVTNDFSADNLASLKKALEYNKNITSLVFTGAFPTTTTDYFTGINPNCLKFVPAGTTTQEGWSNFVAGTSALTPIALSDGFPFSCPNAITATAGVSYTRNFASDWETIALPFKVTGMDNLSEYTVKKYDGLNGDGELVFTKLGALSENVANTPYIINGTGTIVFNGASGTTIQTTAASGGQSGSDPGALNITYNEITANTGMYVLAADGKAFVKATTPIAPFRAYFKPASTTQDEYALESDLSSFRQIISSIGIYNTNGGVIINSDQLQTISVYGIDGRKVRTVEVAPGTTTVKLDKGIYIINNKKFVVR